MGLTVYNLAQSFTFVQGDVVTIPDPCLRKNIVNHNVRPPIDNSHGYVHSNPICGP